MVVQCLWGISSPSRLSKHLLEPCSGTTNLSDAGGTDRMISVLTKHRRCSSSVQLFPPDQKEAVKPENSKRGTKLQVPDLKLSQVVG